MTPRRVFYREDEPDCDCWEPCLVEEGSDGRHVLAVLKRVFRPDGLRARPLCEAANSVRAPLLSPDPQPPGAEMTTIDEAKARLAASFTSLGSPTVILQEDVRTLLSSYDEMKGRIEEAVRLLEPFAREAALVSDTIPDAVGIVEDVWPSLTFGDLRAIAAFVSNKGDG